MKICLIPAAGKGVRFYELGKHYPKCLLPYKHRPIIDHTIKRVENLVDEIRVIVGHQSKEIYNYFVNYPCKKLNIYELDYDGPQGPLKSMYCGLKGNETSILMLLSDSLYNFQWPNNGDFISAMKVNDYSRWCMVDNHCNFIDKPKIKPKTNLAVSGCYGFSNPQYLIESIKFVIDNANDEAELQFSQAFELYNKKYPFEIIVHDKKEIIDFGTLEDYLKNHSIGKARSFNKIIETDNETIIKSSETFPEKIISEGLWMDNIPDMFHKNVPKVVNINVLDGTIEMEKINYPTLREVFLFIDKSYETWRKIFISLLIFINKCKKTERKNNSFWSKIVKKTNERSQFQEKSFVKKLENTLKEAKIYHDSTFYHGDLHFNNIFYNFSSDTIIFIDPRGEFYGHYLYDIAKLNHSVNGHYDYIDEGLYFKKNKNIVFYNKGDNEVKAAFKDIFINNLTTLEKVIVNQLTASLFLSMIPLHSESVQNQKLFYSEYLYFKNEKLL